MFPCPTRSLSAGATGKIPFSALKTLRYQDVTSRKNSEVSLELNSTHFSDASQEAIGACVYLQLFDERKRVSIALVYVQSRVAPINPTSIPRLELCGAVLASEAVRKVMKEIDMDIARIMFYTDSKVVLGYIKNATRRFHVYVANRVQQILNVSKPEQWKYIESESNSADQATRGIKPGWLNESTWINGPEFLRNGKEIETPRDVDSPSEDDPEVRKKIVSHEVDLQRRKGLGARRFLRFSCLSSLQSALAHLITKVREFKQRRGEQQEQVQYSAIRDKIVCGQ